MEPTIGRIVYYNAGGTPDQPLQQAALICSVIDDETVNLVVFDQNGGSRPRLGVKHGTEIGQWDWPQYQQEQAKKKDE